MHKLNFQPSFKIVKRAVSLNPTEERHPVIEANHSSKLTWKLRAQSTFLTFLMTAHGDYAFRTKLYIEYDMI
jgi:hypothetical protein